MKKLFSLLLAGTLMVSVGACSPSTPDAPAPQAGQAAEGSAGGESISVWAWDPAFNVAIMNTAGNYYTAANPGVSVAVQEMAKADVEQKLHTNLASKMTQGLPDIVLIEDYNAQKYLQSYPGAFADLTNAIDYSTFAPYKVELMKVNGSVYGVPFDSGVSGLFYRKDLLEEAGFKAEDLNDITWDRYIEIAKEVKAKTGKAFLSFDKADGGFIRIMLNSAGEWYYDAEGNPNVAKNEALKEAMETYKKILDADIIKPTAGWTEWVGAFNSGEAASVLSGCWIVGSVKSATDQSGLWAVAPVPRLNYSKSINASNLGGSSWYVLEASKNKDKAIDFLKSVYAGNVDFYQEILTNNGAVAAYLPAQEGSAYKNEDAFFGNQAVFAELGTWMNKIIPINYGLYTYEADAAVMGQLEDYLSGKKTVEQALTDAEAQLSLQVQ